MKIRQTKLFKKQARLMAKRGADLGELRDAVEAILNNDVKRLAELSDHPLRGQLRRDRELHVGGHGDWLLRYRVSGNTVTLWLLATGSHRQVLNIE